MAKPKLAIILGIRPDVIRASLVLNKIRAVPDVDVTFIWSGQHYSDNLKDIFFRELEGEGPLGAQGVALVPGRALAVDRRYLPLGIPAWIDARRPEGRRKARQGLRGP